MDSGRLVGDIVVGIDFSEPSADIVAEAAALASASGGVLHVVHVAAGEPILAGYDKEEVNPFTRDDRADELVDEHHQMREMAARLAHAYDVEVVPLVTMGPTADTLLQVVAHFGATHLVVGSHGHGGLHHLLVGSVAEEIVRRTSVPVVIVPIGRS